MPATALRNSATESAEAKNAGETPAILRDVPLLGGDGIMRFPWNGRRGILFFTTRSPRFAAFLREQENHKSDIHDCICSSYVIGPQGRA
jgi:hypothetical protein